MNQKINHPNSKARDWAVQFLYQCETEKLFHFSQGHFDTFAANFGLDGKLSALTQSYVQGVFKHQDELKPLIESHSKNWTLTRMPTTDRCVLKVASYELCFSDAPAKVAINEAIDLAKKYGTQDSGSFVNAILDKIAKSKNT